MTMPASKAKTGSGRPARIIGAAILLSAAMLSGASAQQTGGRDSVAPPPSGVVPVPEPFGAPDPENPLAMPDPPASGGIETAEPVIGGEIGALPRPVRRMREMIMEAAEAGDFDALRPLIGSGRNKTQLSLSGYEGDPVAYLKSLGGDAEGYEILAILAEVLEADYAIYDPGTENEVYVWPYFVATSLDDLTPQQYVDLFKLVTSGDYADMQAFGGYIFYRVGITPEGRWRFFVAGD